MRFRYLAPLYRFSSDQSHIGAPAHREKSFRELGENLSGSNDLVAIYIPESAPAVYRPGNQRGRVVGAVRLLPMPEGQSIYDYQFCDDRSRQWPFGWPCRVVYAPEHFEECPKLRDIVEDVRGPNSFGRYVGQLQHGPFELASDVANKLEAWFARFPTVSA